MRSRTFAVILALSIGLLGAAVAHNFGLIPLDRGSSDGVARNGSKRPRPAPTGGTGSGSEVDTSEESDADGPAALVPEEAFLYAEIASMATVDSLLKRFAARMDPMVAGMMNGEAMLGQMLTMVGGDVSKVDMRSRLGVAVTMGQSGQPAVTLIIPTREPQDFARTLQMPPGFAEPLVNPRYVGITMAPSYTVGSAPAEIATNMPEGAFSLRLKMQPIRPMLEPAMGQMRAEAEARVEATPAPGYMEGVDFAMSLMEAIEQVEMGIDPDGDSLGLSFAMEVAQGSSWEMPRSEASTLHELTAYVDDEDSFCMLATWNQEFLEQTVRPLMEQLQGIALASGEGADEAAFQAFDKALSMLPMFGEEIAVSGRFEVGGMRSAVFCRPDVPDVLFESFPIALATLDLQSMGLVAGEMEREELEGGRAARMKVRLSDALMAPRMARGAQAVELLFGAPSIDVRIASKDGHLALLVGGDDEWQTAQLAKLGTESTGEAQGRLAKAFAQIDDASPSLVYQIDMLAMMREMVTLIAEQMDLDPSEDLERLESALGQEPLWITAYAAVDGTRWSGGMQLDWDRFLDFVEMSQSGGF